MASSCIFMVPGLTQPWEEQQKYIQCVGFTNLCLKILVGASMKRKNYISTEMTASIGTSRPVNLSWSSDSSSCIDLHRDAWRQPGPDHHSPVTQKNSQHSMPWCQCREIEPAVDRAISVIISRLDQEEMFQEKKLKCRCQTRPDGS